MQVSAQGPNGVALDSTSTNRVEAAHAWLVASQVRDGGRDYPGIDMDTLRAYSDGDMLEQLEADARMPVRPQDKAVFDDLNAKSGGHFQDSLKVWDAYFDPDTQMSVITIDVTNPLHDSEQHEQGWWITTRSCDRNPTGWCVTDATDESPYDA